MGKQDYAEQKRYILLFTSLAVIYGAICIVLLFFSCPMFHAVRVYCLPALYS